MIKKNNSIISGTGRQKHLFAFLLILLISIIEINFADAQSKGRDIIREKPSVMDKALPNYDNELREMGTRLNDSSISDAEKEFLQDQRKSIQEDLYSWYEDNVDPLKEEEAIEYQDLLADAWENGAGDDKEAIEKRKLEFPITSIGYDYINNSLEVTIDPMFFSEENIKKYIEKIREIIGDEIDLTISPKGYAVPDTCTSRLGDCEPLEGGVKYTVGVQGCTIGVKATFNNEVGFVTAGHCFDNKIGKDVKQPYSYNTIVGTTVKETFFNNSNCDCGFIKTTRTMSDEVFGITPKITGKGIIKWGTIVEKSGAITGISCSSISKISITIMHLDGTHIRRYVESAYLSVLGDSGSPVMATGLTGKTLLMGIHSAYDIGNGRRYFSPHFKVESNFPGLQWGF